MTTKNEINRWIELGTIVIEGNWQEADLACPICESRRIIFSFTRNKPPRYGLFIKCLDCNVYRHYSLSEKPLNFRDDLILLEFQQMEDEARKRADQ